jgi:hypothetical protein
VRARIEREAFDLCISRRADHRGAPVDVSMVSRSEKSDPYRTFACGSKARPRTGMPMFPMSVPRPVVVSIRRR